MSAQLYEVCLAEQAAIAPASIPALLALLGEQPSDWVLWFVFAANIAGQDASQESSHSISPTYVLANLRGTPEEASRLFVLADTDTDGKLFPLGFIEAALPLHHNTHTMDVDVLLDAELAPIPQPHEDADEYPPLKVVRPDDSNDAEAPNHSANSVGQEDAAVGEEHTAEQVYAALLDHLQDVAHACGRDVLRIWKELPLDAQYSPYDEQSHYRTRGWSAVYGETTALMQLPSTSRAVPDGMRVEFIHNYAGSGQQLEVISQLLNSFIAEQPTDGLDIQLVPWTVARLRSQEMILQARKNEAITAVLYQSEQPIGISMVSRRFGGDVAFASLGSTYVAPEYRRQGLATVLITALAQYAKSHWPSLEALSTTFNAADPTAKALLDSFGAQERSGIVAWQKRFSCND